MAITKAVASNVLSGVTTSQSSTANSTTGDYAMCWYIKAVVSSSPAAAATFYVQQSPDGSTYYYGPTYSVPLTNGTYYWQIAIDPTCESTIITFAAGTAGDCAFSAQLGQVTAV
jgi:hypothetical protein